MDDAEPVAYCEFILRLLRCFLDYDDDGVVIDTTSKSPLFPDFDGHLRIRVVVSKSALTDLLPSPRLCVLHFCGVVVVVVVVVVVAPVVVVVVPNMVSRTTPVVE